MSRGPHGRIALPKEDIIRQYNQGSSTPELGAKYGVSRVTILNRLREWEVEVRRPNSWQLGRHHTEKTKLRIAESVRGYYATEHERGSNGEEYPGVSESPPASPGPPAYVDPHRQSILELEAKIADTEVSLRRTRKLKQIHEQELAMLKATIMRRQFR